MVASVCSKVSPPRAAARLSVRTRSAQQLRSPLVVTAVTAKEGKKPSGKPRTKLSISTGSYSVMVSAARSVLFAVRVAGPERFLLPP